MQRGDSQTAATRAKIAEAQKRRHAELRELIAKAKALGFEQIDGRWYPPEELRELRKAAGYDESGIRYG